MAATKKQDSKTTTTDEVKVKKELTLADYRTVVGKAKAGMKRATILADMPHLNQRMVAKIQCAEGITKAKPTVVERDRAIISACLKKAGETRTTPWSTGSRKPAGVGKPSATRSSQPRKRTTKAKATASA